VAATAAGIAMIAATLREEIRPIILPPSPVRPGGLRAPDPAHYRVVANGHTRQHGQTLPSLTH
jgi:hypothetical protein